MSQEHREEISQLEKVVDVRNPSEISVMSEVAISKVRSQILFYFSEGNLQTDLFLIGEIQSDPQRWVKISLILKFGMLKQMGCTEGHVITAFTTGSGFMELSPCWKKIRRREKFVNYSSHEYRKKTVILFTFPECFNDVEAEGFVWFLTKAVAPLSIRNRYDTSVSTVSDGQRKFLRSTYVTFRDMASCDWFFKNVCRGKNSFFVKKMKNSVRTRIFVLPVTEYRRRKRAKLDLDALFKWRFSPGIMDWKNVEPSSEPTVAVENDTQGVLQKMEVRLSLREQQCDKSSPLYPRAEWDEMGIHAGILKGIYRLGYNQPSTIQRIMIGRFLQQTESIIAMSQSGTGKTACFAVAAVNSVDVSRDVPQVIIVSPTFELCGQNSEMVKAIGYYRSGLKVLDTSDYLQSGRFRGSVKDHIISGTPGKILSLIKERKLCTKNVKLLVLDEADALLDTTNSLRDQSVAIKHSLSVDVRILLFSETYSIERKGNHEMAIKSIYLKFVPRPRVFILLPKERMTIFNIRQYKVVLDGFGEKVKMISRIIEESGGGQCVIFANDKSNVDKVHQLLAREGHSCSSLHSGHSIPDRKKTFRRFQTGCANVLITTNVFSRGVDFPMVTVVVNFDIPVDYKVLKERGVCMPDFHTYLHRIGRTGRFGGYGVAMNLVQRKRDEILVDMIEKYFRTYMVEVDPWLEATNLNTILNY